MRKPVRDVLNEVQRFIDACSNVSSDLGAARDNHRAAALRASLDLSRALTEFRKPWPDRD